MAVYQLPDGLALADYRPRKRRNTTITRIDPRRQEWARNRLIRLFPDRAWNLDLDEDLLRMQIFAAVAAVAGLTRAELEVLTLDCLPPPKTAAEIAQWRGCAPGSVYALRARWRAKLKKLRRQLETTAT